MDELQASLHLPRVHYSLVAIHLYHSEDEVTAQHEQYRSVDEVTEDPPEWH